MFGMRNTADGQVPIDPVSVDPVPFDPVSMDTDSFDPFEVSFVPGRPDVAWVDPFPDGVMGYVPGRTTESVPDRLDEMAPGPVLAAFMASVDVSRLSGYDVVSVLIAHQRLASHFQAAVYRDMIALVDVFAQDCDQPFAQACADAEAEVRVALHLTRRAAEGELSFALELHRRIPAVLEALACGAIDVRRAKVIEHHTIDLPVGVAQAIVAQVINEAPHLTTGELAALLRRLRVETDPEEATSRMERAVEDRRVILEATPAGTANLHAYDLPPERAVAIMERINHTARMLPTDGRTVDQRRADVVMDILEGTTNAASVASVATGVRRGVVDLHVDLDTLAGMNNRAGELAGYGPVVADIARKVAANGTSAEWRYTVTDPDTGAIIDVGTTRRRPTARQRRDVEARDRTCVFPGCRMPALASDLDHRIPWAESRHTATADLAPLCRHCHRIRHRSNWAYRRLPDGQPQWTTKTGRTYTTRDRPP
jgi:hypothetical protein